jgi:hypothetical protein
VHHVHLSRAANAGHFAPECLGYLHRICAHAAGGAVDQYLLPRLDLPFVAKGQEGGDSRLGYGRRLLERHVGWLVYEEVLFYTPVLCESAKVAYPEYLVTRLEQLDVGADLFDTPGYVVSEDVVLRLSQPPCCQAEKIGFTRQDLPVNIVDGCRMDFDQHLIVLGSRFLHLSELKDIRRSIFLVYNGFHKSPLF